MGTRTAEQFISIHSPRMGRDGGYITFPRVKKNFNPLSPHGERHRPWPGIRPPRPFQSTLPAWGETLRVLRCIGGIFHFNPLSPHGERPARRWASPPSGIFQSTLPAWGETKPVRQHRRAMVEISIHSPRMGRDLMVILSLVWLMISIHSPRMGRDGSHFVLTSFSAYFNPLSPHGERHIGRGNFYAASYFNPLSPHGERRILHFLRRRIQRFQSTLPAWGETVRLSRVGSKDPISIHSPRMGRDQYLPEGAKRQERISIHSPRMGRDVRLPTSCAGWRNFNPLSPHGERPVRLRL